jgi:hypothetical protein
MLEDGIDMVKRGETSVDELLRIIPVSQLAEIRKRMGHELFNWDTWGQSGKLNRSNPGREGEGD